MNGPQTLALNSNLRKQAADNEQRGVRSQGHIVAVSDVGEIEDAVDQGQADSA